MSKFWTTVILISLMVFWELVNPFIKFEGGKLKNYLFNGAIGLANNIITSVSVGLVFAYIFKNPLGLISPSITNTLWFGVLSFVFLEVYIYCWHRFMMHGTSWGWKLHKLHHSDDKMNSTSAFRFHIVEVILSQIPRIGLVYLLSIPLEVFVLYELIFVSMNIFQHSNITIGNRLDKLISMILITPNLHKVHHSTNSIETDTNFATIFSIWDSLFQSRKYRTDFKKDFKLGLEE